MKPKKVNLLTVQALDFIASRLLNFRRVQYEEFCELVKNKYALQDADQLFFQLVKKEAAYISNGMIVAVNDDILKMYCIAPHWQEERLRNLQLA